MKAHTPLYRALRGLGLTVRGAAEIFGVSEEHLGNVASGRTYASEEVLLGLARLGINPNEVLPERSLAGTYLPNRSPHYK